eukprot:TRINITY_DN1941_c0_g1_i13.p1 TRINITY_DN1941_c0_g1~~TRINITY_DN1941_c0_g1_i13.p1  ORF type:complete len:349 (+),score=44.50 TRINITY_DN1941_c0_g1_i13:115-1047(+)
MADRDIILAAVQAGRYGALREADSLLGDPDFLLAALEAGCPCDDVFERAREPLKSDRDFVLASLRVYLSLMGAGREAGEWHRGTVVPRYGHPFYLAHASLREDSEFLRAAVALDQGLLHHTVECYPRIHIAIQKAVASDPSLFAMKHYMEARKSVFFKVVQKFPHVLKYAPEPWNQDHQIVHVAVKANAASLKHAHQSLKADPDIVFAAVQSDPSALKYADETLVTNKSVVLSILQKIPGIFPYVHESLQTDRDVVLVVVQKSPCLLRHVHKSLTADHEFMHAVMQTPRASKYVGRTLQPTGNPFLVLGC